MVVVVRWGKTRTGAARLATASTLERLEDMVDSILLPTEAVMSSIQLQNIFEMEAEEARPVEEEEAA